jgi:hypothetical protein
MTTERRRENMTDELDTLIEGLAEAQANLSFDDPNDPKVWKRSIAEARSIVVTRYHLALEAGLDG